MPFGENQRYKRSDIVKCHNDSYVINQCYLCLCTQNVAWPSFVPFAYVNIWSLIKNQCKEVKKGVNGWRRVGVNNAINFRQSCRI